ncbi:RNA-directed DNA polymerase from mobile element jockey [Exaiptasia diaphana]|nr:RNA-directed DNA polymerase from mobile element jockey [Exaiptasia diaphana]
MYMYTYEIHKIPTDIKNTSKQNFKAAQATRKPSEHPDTYSIENNWQYFKTGLLKILEERVPCKRLGSWNDTPWITKNLKKSLKKKKRLYNIYKRSGLESDKKIYRDFQKSLKSKLSKSQDEYIAKTLDSDLRERPKKFWSYIKSKRQDQVGIPPLKNDNNCVKADSLGKAEILSNHFSRVFTKEDVSHIPNMGNRSFPAMDSIFFNPEGVEKLIKELDVKKASGPDKLPTRLLKETAGEIKGMVSFLCNQSYKTGELPKDWSNANIVPVFKKGAQHDPANYRPVSLTVVLCKLMEHVIYRNI